MTVNEFGRLFESLLLGVHHTIFHHIGIFGMDEDAMRSWWAKFKADPTYRLFHRSCATTVAKALAAGNHDSLTLDDNSAWTPFGVWAYAQQIYWTRKLLGG